MYLSGFDFKVLAIKNLLFYLQQHKITVTDYLFKLLGSFEKQYPKYILLILHSGVSYKIDKKLNLYSDISQADLGLV